MRNNKKIIIVAICLLSIVVFGAFLFWGNYNSVNQANRSHSQTARLTDTATSNRNLALMDKAVSERDVKICDQINGAINYTDPNLDSHARGFSRGLSTFTPAMTETEAKQSCRDHIQQLIDQKNYEDKVCADENATYYEFDNAKWSCPNLGNLLVPELNIEIASTPKSFNDLNYKVNAHGTDPVGYRSAEFSTAKLGKLAPTCSIGTLAKITGKYTANSQYNLVKQYTGFNFWIGYHEPSSMCSKDKNTESLYESQSAIFKALVSGKYVFYQP